MNREDTDNTRLMCSAHNVAIALQTGVTTVCDCGGWNKTTFSLKEAIKQGLVNGPASWRLADPSPPPVVTAGSWVPRLTVWMAFGRRLGSSLKRVLTS